MEIDVTKYFKIHRDEYSRIFAIETVGDEQELIKEIRKQNEQLHCYKQAIEKIFFCLIKENRKGTIKDTIWLNSYTTLWDYIAQILDIKGDQNEIENQIIQKCEDVNE